jgi:uncharacterized protein (TIGR00369 family)
VGSDGPEDRTRPAFGGDRGWGVAAYLAMPIHELTDGSEPYPLLRARFEAPDHLVDADGRTPTGVLAALCDSIGGMACGLASLPDWIVTTNLTLRRPPSSMESGAGGGPLQLDTEVLRRGRSAVVSRTVVTDASGGEVGTAWMTAAVLTPAGGPPAVTRPVRPRQQPTPDDPAYRTRPHEFFALAAGRRPGEVALHLSERMRNPWGILHGGGVAVLLEAAASSAAADVATGRALPEVAVTDLVVHYLSPGRVGPVHATATALGTRGRDHLVRVSVRDHGADDRPVALAVATVRHLG